MLRQIEARANTRALFGAVAFGSAMGVVLGVAYLAGGATRAAVDHAQAQRIALAAGSATAVTALPQARPAGTPPELRPALPASAEANLHLAEVKKPRREIDCLTDAVYYEARGESQSGQQAVAQVVLNRVRHAGFPKTICGVVYQGVGTGQCQFSFACDGSTRHMREPAAWRHAHTVAAHALGGFVMQQVGNATHFHVASLGGVWGAGLMKVAQVGAHVFYRLSGRTQATQLAHNGAVAKPGDPGEVSMPSPELILASAVATPAAAQPAPPATAPRAPAAAEPAKPASAGEKPGAKPASSEKPAAVASAATVAPKEAS